MSLHTPLTLRRYNHYRKKDVLIVIKYGAEWCGPCKKANLLLETYSEKYPNVYFLDVDIENEEFSELKDMNNIRTIPHFKFFLNTELKREIVGFDPNRIKRYVERYQPDQINQTDLNKIKPKIK